MTLSAAPVRSRVPLSLRLILPAHEGITCLNGDTSRCARTVTASAPLAGIATFASCSVVENPKAVKVVVADAGAQAIAGTPSRTSMFPQSSAPDGRDGAAGRTTGRCYLQCDTVDDAVASDIHDEWPCGTRATPPFVQQHSQSQYDTCGATAAAPSDANAAPRVK